MPDHGSLFSDERLQRNDLRAAMAHATLGHDLTRQR
jgi:hypothetical protein